MQPIYTRAQRLQWLREHQPKRPRKKYACSARFCGQSPPRYTPHPSGYCRTLNCSSLHVEDF
jgi:hypothetical protein